MNEIERLEKENKEMREALKKGEQALEESKEGDDSNDDDKKQ
jgi:hypothetical protein